MEKKSKQNKRLRIGLLINEIEGYYSNQIWRNVSKAVEEKDCDFIIFEGGMLESTFAYNRQLNIAYKFVSRDVVDGLILVSGPIGIYLSQEELYSFFKNFMPIPMVSISFSFPGIPGIQIDNHSGLFDLVEHLITEHGYRNIAFVTGPDGNTEATIRFSAYCDALKKHNVPFNPDLVAKGLFIPTSGAEATQELLGKKVQIDAIVYANDDMAMAGMEVIKKAGLKIPADIAIAGFDDIEVARGTIPSLTTVRQPLIEQAFLATDLIISKIRGEDIPDVSRLSTQMVIRQSCGCLKSRADIYTSSYAGSGYSSKSQIELSAMRKNSYDRELEKKQLLDVIDEEIKNPALEGNLSYVLFDKLSECILSGKSLEEWQLLIYELCQECNRKGRDLEWVSKANEKLHLAQMLVGSMLYIDQADKKQNFLLRVWDLRNLVYANVTTFDLNELMNVLDRAMPRLKISSIYIALYREGSFFYKGRDMELQEEAELIYSMTDKRRDSISRNKRYFACKKLLPDGCWPKDKRLNIIVKPLFFQEEHFGFVVFELSFTEELFYEGLRGQISNAVKGSTLLKAREEAGRQLKSALKQLEKHNKRLNILSQKDELTGLYNRRGLLSLGKSYMEAAEKSKETFMVFFADMDGLKAINDTYGHKEGDWAIKTQADILKRSFRDKDILGRLGGDEFIILAVNSRLENLQAIKARIYDNLEEANAKSEKPYKLSISLGVIPYLHDKEMTFEEILKEADDLLYIEKMNKKNGKSH